MKNVFRKAASLILSAALVLSMAVTPAMAADTKDPPTAVENCEKSGVFTTVLALGFSDSDWMNAITDVVVGDTPYSKGKIDSWSSTTGIWEVGSLTGAYGGYTALKLALDSSTTFPAAIAISAAGYKDLTVKVTKADKWGDTYTAEVVVNSDNGSTNPDTPSGDRDAPTNFTTVSNFGYDFKLTFQGASEWLDAIEGVNVNDTAWAKKSSSSVVWNNQAYYVDAQSGYILIGEGFDGETATCVISAKGYKDLTLKLDKTNHTAAVVESKPSAAVIDLSDVSFATDFSGNDWNVTFGEKNNGYVGNITGVSVNGTAWEKKENYDPSAGGTYRVNSDTQKLVFAKKDFSPNPTVLVLKSGDVITITANGYEDLTFKLIIDTDGKVSVVADDGQGDIYQLHVKIEGSFEAAIVGQKDYDGVSSASTGGATSNKNSSVTVYGARLAKGETPTDADWKALDAVADPSTGYIGECSVSIVPDTAKGTNANADSGMKGVFIPAISSSLSLSGTPKDPGSYLISVTVTDDQGRTATSNALPFRIYTGEETLADQLVLGNLKQYQSGKYAWDIMEPWAIKNFGSNVTGETESVRVPADLEAWFGSHESGLYGYLGYDLAWNKVLAGEIPQTLYIPNGCDLTITNMEILSSVRIVVENGGKLTLSDSTVQGMIDVQSGGTFSMNYDAYNQEFTTGASVCGQIRLADGAILENAAIYSHANYLANGDLTDRTTHEPVVVANGNVTVKGKVFINGEEAGDNVIGQTGLLVKDGTLTLADNATLVVYGGAGKVQIFPKGGTAIELDNGTITGNGKLVAIGGQPLWGEGGDAVTGTGTISTVEAFLQGATASASNKQAPGQAVKGDVTVISPKQHKENGTVKDTVADDPLDDLYWKIGIAPEPPLDKFVTKDVPNGPEITGHQVTVNGSYADVTGAGEYAERAEVSISAGSRSGYTFSGWTGSGVTFRDASSADTTFIMPGQNVTVTANWTKNSSSSGSHSSGSSSSNKTYAPTVDSAENGDVTVAPKNPAKGDTVTITVKPDSGYETGTVTVKDADGNTIKATDKGDGTYTFTQPASKVTVFASFVKSGTGFADVASGAYYADAVAWAVDNGITNGKASGLFGSNDPCTRGQIVTFLWRAAGSPAPKGTAAVPADVLPGSYCYDAVAWALENGITNGTTGTTFSPNAACTRAQCVTVLFRSAVANGLEAVTLQNLISGFSDAASLSGYAVPAMNWALANEIVQGNGGALMPNGTCTRAQITTFLYRANLGK